MAVGKGWSDLVVDLRCELAALGVEKVDVFERWGTLKASATPPDPALLPQVLQIRDRYERLSETVCEACGQPGEPRTSRRWIKTLCDQHIAIEAVPLHVVPEPERIILRGPRMLDLNPRMRALLADGWEMVRMTKPVSEGFGIDVVVWFERPVRREP